jgi:glutamine amidotransferase
MKLYVGVIDIGLGNIASIVRIIEKVGGKAIMINQTSQLKNINKIVLPGVGHFDEGMKKLKDSGLAEMIVELTVQSHIQIMGICLGMHLLCRGSEEGLMSGLGLIDADVKRFRFSKELKLKVPHMGWNIVSQNKPNPLLPVNDYEQRFYFVHSYKVVPDQSEVTIGSTDYGGNFCAAFQKGMIFGVQFHPEKSHRFGMALMRRFVEL